MQIPKNLPQFAGNKSLIIVSGEFQAKFYVGYNGQVTLLDSFFVANPRAETQEDYLKSTKLGISGSIYNSAKQEVQQKFLRQLGKETGEILKKYNIADIYLFCVDFMIKMVRETLPDTLRRNIRFEYRGDMQYHTPLKLLEIIQKTEDEKREQNSAILFPEK